MVQAPSETDRGQAWLDNFPDHDRNTAQVLLDSIRFATVSLMHQTLRSRLDDMMSSGDIQPPAMVIPAQDLNDLSHKRDQTKVDPSKHVAFETFDLNQDIAVLPGSEGWVGNLVKTLLANGPSDWRDPSTTKFDIGERGKDSCRSLVLVTDYAGSGNQLEQYARAIVRNPQIRAWRSWKYLEIVAVSFAATSTAVHRLESTGSPIDRFIALEIAPTLHEFPRSNWQRAVLDLCKKYGRGSNRLGYQDSAGLFVSDATIPNNLPQVLCRSGQGWVPFFKGRSAPVDLIQQVGEYSAEPDLIEQLETARHMRIAASLERRSGRSQHHRIIAALVELEQHQFDEPSLCLKLGVTPHVLGPMLDCLQSMGFLDSNKKLTALGHKELIRRKHAPRKSKTAHSGSPDPYYPWSMR